MAPRTPRKIPASILVSELPSFLRDEVRADLVAVAIEAQASATDDEANGFDDGQHSVILAALRAQADAYRAAATDVRLSAKAVASLGVRFGESS